MKRIRLITLIFLSQAFLFAHAETLKYSHPNKSQATVSPTAPVSNKVQPNTASANTNDEKHEFVDLGLSVQWATTNIGAENPEDDGDFFAWGETTPKEFYDWGNYKWSNGSETTLTKYCTNGEFGKLDSKLVLEPADDASTANWGPDWHTPSLDEWDELINKCTWTKTTIGDKDGYKVTGKNGNWIFLPEAGICEDINAKHLAASATIMLEAFSDGLSEEEMEELTKTPTIQYSRLVNTGLYYLSNALNPKKSNNVVIMRVNSGDINKTTIDRSMGYSVRPVRSKPSQSNQTTVNSVSLNKISLSLEIGESETLTATASPSNATDQALNWKSSDNSVASVSNGRIMAESVGTATITVESSNGKSSTCSVTVKPKKIVVNSVSLNKIILPLEIGDSETLTATVSPSNATDQALYWKSSDNSVASVTDGRINAKSAGTATVTVKSSNGKSSTCTVTVKKKSPQYVDLGLSVKWATTNIGADNPEDSGDYFAWGETKPKHEYYWETYKYCINKNYKLKLTKYCYIKKKGYKRFRDNRLSLDPEDDAATANWGSDWRMPTKEELEELRTQCKWVWDEMNGKPGYRVIGKNGNMIFLPETGYIIGHTPYLRYTSFWSRSISDRVPSAAVTIDFYLNESSNKRMIEISSGYREFGLTVRPVHP